MQRSLWMFVAVGVIIIWATSLSNAVQSIPSRLVGSWYAGSGFTSVPYNPATGQWGRPSGKGLVYIFRADGSYTKAFQSYNSSGGCTNGFTAFEHGVMQANATQLYLHPTSGQMQVRDSCVSSLNEDKPISVSDELFTWEFTAEGLYLQRSDGAASTFRPLE